MNLFIYKFIFVINIFLSFKPWLNALKLFLLFPHHLKLILTDWSFNTVPLKSSNTVDKPLINIMLLEILDWLAEECKKVKERVNAENIETKILMNTIVSFRCQV